MTQPLVDPDLSEGDLAFERELLSLFVEDTDNHLQVLKAALECLSPTLPSPAILETIWREAHHIKGASGNLNAQLVYELAQQLSQQARLSQCDQLMPLCVALEAAYADIRQQIQRRLQDLDRNLSK